MRKNIEKAIAKYEEYILVHNSGDVNANVNEYLAIGGYDNQEEFHNDQQEYLLKHLNFEIHEEPIDENVVFDMITKAVPSFQYSINTTDGIQAFVPKTFNNWEILEEYNIKPIKLGYISDNGLILTDKGDLRVVINIPNHIEIYTDYFMEKLKNLISKYYDDVEVNNNDLIVNGRKVIGSVDMKNDNVHTCMFQITFNDNTEIIEKICGIREKKVGCLDSDIISQEEIKNAFISWLQ